MMSIQLFDDWLFCVEVEVVTGDGLDGADNVCINWWESYSSIGICWLHLSQGMVVIDVDENELVPK